MSTLRFLKAAKSTGHKITLVFIGLASGGLSARRVLDRVRQGGHAVPVSAIRRRYPDTLAKLPRAAALSDRVFVLDNSGERRRLLLASGGERIRFLARDPPGWFADLLPLLEAELLDR